MAYPKFTDFADYIQTASGNYTQKYINVFNRYGTDMQMDIYPISGTAWAGNWPHMDGTADDYKDPVSGQVKVFLDPEQVSDTANRSTWAGDAGVSYATVVREGVDHRRFYCPPNIASGFILWGWTAGATRTTYYGRDVLLFTFNNRFYHVQTMIPHFIANQIVYYEMNTQVVNELYWPWENTYDAYWVTEFREAAIA